jgi:hypothetical protein
MVMEVIRDSTISSTIKWRLLSHFEMNDKRLDWSYKCCLWPRCSLASWTLLLLFLFLTLQRGLCHPVCPLPGKWRDELLCWLSTNYDWRWDSGVLFKLILRPGPSDVVAWRVVLFCMCLWLCERGARSSAKSRWSSCVRSVHCMSL